MAGPRPGGSRGDDQLRRFRRLADLTVFATFALILLGGIVRVSESGLGCGPGGSGTEGWPLCNGEAVPFFHNTEVIIEFSHRTLAAIVTALIVALVWIAYKHLRDYSWPLRASLGALALVLVQAGLGGLTVEKSLAEELVAAHLGLAMILIGVMLWMSVRARSELDPDRAKSDASGSALPIRGLKGLAGTAAVLLLCAIVAGGYVAGTEEEGKEAGINVNGAHSACGDQFPGCLNEGAFPFGISRLTDIHLTHRAFVYAASLAILALLIVAFRRGSRSRLLAVGGALLLLQLLLGALNVWLGEHATLIVAHLVTATLLWSTVVLIAFRLAWAPQPVGAEAGSAAPGPSPSAAAA
jgi:heme A synthase